MGFEGGDDVYKYQTGPKRVKEAYGEEVFWEGFSMPKRVVFFGPAAGSKRGDGLLGGGETALRSRTTAASSGYL